MREHSHLYCITNLRRRKDFFSPEAKEMRIFSEAESKKRSGGAKQQEFSPAASNCSRIVRINEATMKGDFFA